jgi:hypothetical protein
VLACAARAAQTVNRRRRLAALRAKGRLEPHEARPTFRARPSPSTLLNRSAAYDTGDREQEIEKEIEQSAFWETQKARAVYMSVKPSRWGTRIATLTRRVSPREASPKRERRTYFEYGRLWMMDKAR